MINVYIYIYRERERNLSNPTRLRTRKLYHIKQVVGIHRFNNNARSNFRTKKKCQIIQNPGLLGCRIRQVPLYKGILNNNQYKCHFIRSMIFLFCSVYVFDTVYVNLCRNHVIVTSTLFCCTLILFGLTAGYITDWSPKSNPYRKEMNIVKTRIHLYFAYTMLNSSNRW